MQRRTELAVGEAYHIFNRGAHKQPIFVDDQDRRRFQILLFLANHSQAIDVGNVISKYQGPSLVKLFEHESPDKALVDILAYALMPNHFHVVLRQKTDGGISSFMRKVGTAYSMYFNLKHEHSGTLFQGRYKSSYIDTDPYFLWIFSYVHLNPIALYEPGWQNQKMRDFSRVRRFMSEYQFSSYFDFYVKERPERNLLAYEDALEYVDTKADIEGLMADFERDRILYKEF